MAPPPNQAQVPERVRRRPIGGRRFTIERSDDQGA
jgi:hypothetical protein